VEENERLTYAGPEDVEVRAALESILRQPEFQSSPRLSSFLRFVVEETLEGRASRLKAFTIATSVFGRDAAFDPQTNPIVRVEALRLRRMLDQYYSGAGSNDPIEIRVRRGSYVPEFAHRYRSSPAALDAEGSLLAEGGRPVQAPVPVTSVRVLALTLAAVVMIAAGLAAWIWQSPVRQPAPVTAAAPKGQFQATMRVGPFRFGNTPEMTSLAEILETRIEDTISRFDNPLVIHDPERAPDSDYQITASLTAEPDGTAEIGFRMLHVATREIIWTRLVSGVPLDPAKARADGVINGVAASLAQTYGAVFSDMRKRLPKNPADLRGYGCVILAYGALNSPASGAIPEAQTCLERAVSENPTFASGYAALAHIWTAHYLMGTSESDRAAAIERASELANRAVSLAPQKSRPHTAQFTTRFFSGRIEDAFESARIALELNPYAGETLGRVGAAHMSRGEWDIGRGLIAHALASLSVPPGWLEFYLWLDAWQQGDAATAYRHATRRAGLQFPLGILARIIAASEKGDLPAIKRWRERLAANFPVFAADLPDSLARYGIVPDLQERLLVALDTAGVPRTEGAGR
jgi:tetratricopeptide (TPR) repeat protein